MATKSTNPEKKLTTMKKLSDFTGDKGFQIAADVFVVAIEMLRDERNQQQKDEKSPVKMISAFLRNTPDKMRELFAILSETDPKEYQCDGAEALTNVMMLASDPIFLGLFCSQGRTGDAKSSGSVLENTKE